MDVHSEPLVHLMMLNASLLFKQLPDKQLESSDTGQTLLSFLVELRAQRTRSNKLISLMPHGFWKVPGKDLRSSTQRDLMMMETFNNHVNKQVLPYMELTTVNQSLRIGLPPTAAQLPLAKEKKHAMLPFNATQEMMQLVLPRQQLNYAILCHWNTDILNGKIKPQSSALIQLL